MWFKSLFQWPFQRCRQTDYRQSVWKKCKKLSSGNECSGQSRVLKAFVRCTRHQGCRKQRGVRAPQWTSSLWSLVRYAFQSRTSFGPPPFLSLHFNVNRPIEWLQLPHQKDSAAKGPSHWDSAEPRFPTPTHHKKSRVAASSRRKCSSI